MHNGGTPFPISVRNSSVAIADLLRNTGTTILVVSGDPGMQRLAHQVKHILGSEGREIALVDAPTYDDLYNGNEAELLYEVPPRSPIASTDIAVILHSSGGHFLTICLETSNTQLYRVDVIPKADPSAAWDSLQMGFPTVYVSSSPYKAASRLNNCRLW